MPNIEDKRIWPFTKNGQVSPKLAYKIILSNAGPSNLDSNTINLEVFLEDPSTSKNSSIWMEMFRKSHPGKITSKC